MVNEVIWGWGELRRAVCGEINQRWWSVILTAALVVYCSEFIILSNKMKKKNMLFTFDTWFLR